MAFPSGAVLLQYRDHQNLKERLMTRLSIPHNPPVVSEVITIRVK